MALLMVDLYQMDLPIVTVHVTSMVGQSMVVRLMVDLHLSHPLLLIIHYRHRLNPFPRLIILQ